MTPGYICRIGRVWEMSTDVLSSSPLWYVDGSRKFDGIPRVFEHREFARDRDVYPPGEASEVGIQRNEEFGIRTVSMGMFTRDIR